MRRGFGAAEYKGSTQVSAVGVSTWRDMLYRQKWRNLLDLVSPDSMSVLIFRLYLRSYYAF
jgi:hypothetical protein